MAPGGGARLSGWLPYLQAAGRADRSAGDLPPLPQRCGRAEDTRIDAIDQIE